MNVAGDEMVPAAAFHMPGKTTFLNRHFYNIFTAPLTHPRDFGLDLPRPDCLRDYTTVPSEISRFPLMKLMHMPQVSDSGEPK